MSATGGAFNSIGGAGSTCKSSVTVHARQLSARRCASRCNECVRAHQAKADVLLRICQVFSMVQNRTLKNSIPGLETGDRLP